MTNNHTTISNSQIGVVGDHAHVEGGIHFHGPPPANAREARNRATMLQLVHNTWVEGVLNQSLHGAAMLELGKDYTPDAVERPWDVDLYMPDQERRPVPHSAPIIDLFDQASGALLILGDPGSGKTTTLLQLARALIARAQADATAPIPVVFNLSSWVVKQQPLADWLIDELGNKYYIPKKVAQAWVEQDALLLLLDGLDEVRSNAREACIAAINTFRQEHLVPLAVCSRTADYKVLTNKLHLHTAIALHPLTPLQIDVYLTGAGTALQAVRATLQHDPALQEMAQSPLMLSIMTLAYKGLAVEDLQTLATSEARRHHLFEAYVTRMFKHRSKEQPYTRKQIRRWLAWLAMQMTNHRQSIFHIENLQPQWIQAHERYMVRGGVILIISILIALAIHVWTGPYFILVSGLSLALSEWMNSLLPQETSRWSWRRAVIGFGVGLGAVLIYLLIAEMTGFIVYGLFGMLSSGWQLGLLAFGPVLGLVVGLIEGAVGGVQSITCIEVFRWSWKKAVFGFSIGLLVGLVAGLLVGISGELVDGIAEGLIFGLMVGGFIGLPIGFVVGFESTEMQLKMRPNEGVRQSLKSSVITVLIALLVEGIILNENLLAGLEQYIGVVDWTAGYSVEMLLFGLLMATALIKGLILVLGLAGGLVNGGKAVIFHYILRAVLARTNRAPWNYARFLDHCADRILLRKVGGGYIFVHRSLQEHFAAMAINGSNDV